MATEILSIISLKDPALFGLEESILEVGDEVLSVEGHDTRDQLDFYFYGASSDKPRMTVRRRSGEVHTIEIDAETLQDLDIRFAPMTFNQCRCRCPFCFVDQMPPRLRSTLYVKDEDFRFSFLYGNFTTMNDISDAELDKIIEQNLQPQFISVHAVETEIREKIFGRPMKRDICETLQLLARNGISVHAQVVLCPGINDGLHLERTIERLESLHDGIASLSIVPVGLTRHREGLAPIRRFESAEHGAVIDLIENFQARFLASPRKSRFVFASDEWYIACGCTLPPYECFEDFPQIDNGVGMTRSFLREIEEDLDSYGIASKLGTIVIVTGKLGTEIFRRYVFSLLESHGVEEYPSLLTVNNVFFGEMVTITGLLVSEDILESMSASPPDSVYFLPQNCLNYEHKFIDGPDIGHLRSVSGRRIIVPEESLIRSMNECLHGEVSDT